MGISITNYWYPTEDYIKHLLSIWRKKKDSTLDKLQTFLEKIDRYDVLDDTRNMFCTFETKVYKLLFILIAN